MPRKKTNPAEETDQFQADELAEQAEAQAADVEFQTEPPEDVPSPTSDLSVPEIDLSDGDTTEAAEPIQSGVEDIAAETDSGALPASAPQTDTGAWEPVAEIVGVDLSEAVQPPPPSGSSPEDLDALLEDPVPETSAAEVEAFPSELPMEETLPPVKSDRQKFFELKFNRLDRDLTSEERQEWNSIYASYRGRSALTGTIIGVDPFSVQVRNPETGAMERQSMYCATVVPYRVRIVIPATEMWQKNKERPDFVLRNMVGSVIDFIIIKVEREAGFAIGSRRLALRSQRYFFSQRPNLNARGAKIKCRMLSVGPRRCLVECYGHDIGLTQRELRYTAIPDLRNEYHPGQELDCMVTSYDPGTDELEISVKALESNPFIGADQRHPVGSRRLAVIAGKYGGGVFCNLPDGTVCMCNYSYQHEDSDFLVGDHVMLIVQRFDHEKLQMYGKILTKW